MSDLEFQIIDWRFIDEDNEEALDISERQYKIRLFGRTNTNKTVYVR